MTQKDAGSDPSTRKQAQNSDLGPIPVGFITLAAVLLSALAVDVLQEVIFKKITSEARHFITIFFCAIVAAAVAGLAIYRGSRSSTKSAQFDQRRERLETELRHILDSVRLFLWHAEVVEVNGEYQWDMHVSHEESAKRILPVSVPPGRSWSDSWYASKIPEDSQRCDKASVDALRKGLPGYNIEYQCKLANDEIRWFYEDVMIERRGPKRFYVLGASVDITDLKRTEDRLTDERMMIQTVMDSLPDPVFVKSIKGKYLLDNRAHLNLLGLGNQQDLVGKTDFDLFPHSFARPAYVDEQEIIRNGRAIINRVEVSQDSEGNERWFWTSKVPLRDSAGSVIGIVGIHRDVTDKRKEEEELKTAMEAVQQARSEAEHHAKLLGEQATELERARDAALESTRAKSEFLANMSHEIRTPMNGILGITNILIGTSLSDEQSELARTIHSSAEALLTIINDILDFSRIEAGKMQVERVDFNLRSIVEDVTDLVAGSAYRKGLELSCYFAKDVPENLQGDPARIRQVLTNLVGNAIKFTEVGEVLIRARLLGRSDRHVSVQLNVTDTGIGISKEAQSRIFESFTQADGTTTRKYGGTGLGLTICRQLTELMGGAVGVESEEGQGSTFFVNLTLPISKNSAAKSLAVPQKAMREARILVLDDSTTARGILREHLETWGCVVTESGNGEEALQILADSQAKGEPFKAAIVDMQMPHLDGKQFARLVRRDARYEGMPMILYTAISDKTATDQIREGEFEVVLMKPIRQAQLLHAMRLVLGDIKADEAAAANSASKTRRPLGLKVLLAEDNEVNQMVAKTILQGYGCDVELAETGKRAVEKLQKADFDVILMDVHMPEMDGYTATATIRNLGATYKKFIPIIALTAKAMPGDRELCLEAGMDDYIIKPVKPDDLYEVLSRLRARVDLR